LWLCIGRIPLELEALLQLSNQFSRKDISKAKQFSLQLVAQADPRSEVKWLTAAYNYLITMYQQSGQLDSARYFLTIRKTSSAKSYQRSGKI
jgi:hypothetical protein